MSALLNVIAQQIAALDEQTAQKWHEVCQAAEDITKADEHTGLYVEFCVLDALRTELRVVRQDDEITIADLHASITQQLDEVKIDDELLTQDTDTKLKLNAVGDRDARMFYVSSFCTLLEAAKLPVPELKRLPAPVKS